MSLLIISPHYHQETRARAIQVRKLTEGFKNSGLEFYMATLPSPKGTSSKDSRMIELISERTRIDKPYDGPVTANKNILIDFIKNNNISTILTISTPAYSSMLGLSIKKKLPAVRLICYFSDPMPKSILPAPYFSGPSSLLNRIKNTSQKYQIKKVLKIADKIIVPSINTMKCFEKKIKININSKTTCIPHIGGQFEENKKYQVKADLKNTLVYFGDMHRRLSPAFIDACKQAKEDFPDYFKGIVCYGTNNTEEFKKFLIKNNAENLVEIRSSINYLESLHLMRQSGVLLLVEANMTESPFMPSKYFDYLFANRPILAISPIKNSLYEYYTNNDDLDIVPHVKEKIYDAINKIFKSPKKSINRKLEHLKREEIIKQYLSIIDK